MKLKIAMRSGAGSFGYLSRGEEMTERVCGKGGDIEREPLELEGDESRCSVSSSGLGAKSNLVRISRIRGKFSRLACYKKKDQPSEVEGLSCTNIFQTAD